MELIFFVMFIGIATLLSIALKGSGGGKSSHKKHGSFDFPPSYDGGDSGGGDGGGGGGGD